MRSDELYSNSESIVEALHASKESALKWIFEQSYDPLLYFATQYIDDHGLAEEIVSDAFIKLWGKRFEFDVYNQMKSFLYVCTKNACLNSIRDVRRKPLSERLDAVENVIHEDSDLLRHIIHVELLQLVNTQIESLPEKQRQVFNLSYKDELTAEEISARMHISLEAVYTHRSRAVAFLKNKLHPEYWMLLFFIDRL